MQTPMVFGNTKHFRDVIHKADRFSRADWTVLILGPTGAGKEMLARRIHEHSLRAREPFVPVNCAAIPHGLFESELFGFERGAFSGAVVSHRGLVRAAHNGSLFLDEIGDLDINLQAKLLRLLDSGEIRAVGALKTEHVDVRIIAATNVNLYQAVAQGRFRLDLLERLSVLTLQIPALKDRSEDIALLSENILSTIGVAAEEGYTEELLKFDWPGNVRQLKNVLIRASVLGEGAVTRQIINQLIREEEVHAKELAPTSEAVSSNGTLADIEKEVIVERLKRYHGNRKRTAEGLGIAKSTLHEKLRRWKNGAGEFFPVEHYLLSPVMES